MNKDSKKYKNGLKAFIIIVCIVVVGTLCLIFGKNGPLSIFDSGDYATNKSAGIKKGYISVLNVEGTIQPKGDYYNQKWITSNIYKFKNDPKNKAIILYIDSPGGTVYESDETFLALQDYKSSGKKVFAYMGSIAASGGYYIACAADEIYANRNTLTGSIGVISGSFLDLSEFLEDKGIHYETVHAGKNKNMGNYNEPVSDEQRAIMQSVADECYEQFTSIVSKSRDIEMDTLLPLCDGRIYTAKQALECGLIDGIFSWSDFIEELFSEYPEFEKCSLKKFSYEREKGFFESLMNSRVSKNQTDTIEGVPQAVWEEMNLKGPLFLYKR